MCILFIYKYDKIKYLIFLPTRRVHPHPIPFLHWDKTLFLQTLFLAWSPSSNALCQTNDHMKSLLVFSKIIHNVGLRSLSSFPQLKKKKVGRQPLHLNFHSTIFIEHILLPNIALSSRDTAMYNIVGELDKIQKNKKQNGKKNKLMGGLGDRNGRVSGWVWLGQDQTLRRPHCEGSCRAEIRMKRSPKDTRGWSTPVREKHMYNKHRVWEQS